MGDFKHDMDKFVKTDLTGGFDDSPHGSTFGRTRKMANTSNSQNAALEARQRRAREIAEYRISIMEDEQKGKLSVEVLKYRHMVFVLKLLGLITGAISLTPLGAWLLTQVEEGGSIFGGVVFLLSGFACIVGVIYTIAMRVKIKGKPVQYEEMVTREKAHVLTEFKTDSALLTERNRVAELIKQGANEREEKRLQAQRQQEESINMKVRNELEMRLPDIKRIAGEFEVPTAKMLNAIGTYSFWTEQDVINFFNDVLTIYNVRYGSFCFLRRQILSDCPNYKFQSSENHFWFTEGRIRVIKTFFSELKKQIDLVFPDNEHAAVCAIYAVVRMNYIKMLAAEYKKSINASTLEEYCSMFGKAAENKGRLILYICYTIEDDVFSDKGIFAGYDSLTEQVRETVNRQMDEKMKRALFEDNPAATTSEKVVSKGRHISLEETIDAMTGLDFEKFVSGLFRKKGYKTEVTKGSGDFGIDVIADNGIVRIGIQTKCYSGSVGNDAVQQAAAGCLYYGLDKAMVVTNNYFTAAAIQQAKASKVTLWNRDDLVKECKGLGIGY